MNDYGEKYEIKKIPSVYYKKKIQNQYGKNKNHPKLSKYIKMKRK